MEHEQFVDAYSKGELEVLVDNHAAGFLFEQEGAIPQKLRLKQVNIRTAMFGFIILGIVLFFFVKWYFALSCLVFGLVLSTKATSAAGKAVIETSLENPFFYRMAVEKNILTVQPRK